MVTVPAQRADGLYHPLLTVTLRIEGYEELSHPAVVDSGAACTVFPAEVLEANGLHYESLELAPFKGRSATDEFELRVCHGRARWLETDFCDLFLVAESGIELGRRGWGLLGREDFFKTFGVNFAGWCNDPPVFDLELIAEPATTGSQRS